MVSVRRSVEVEDQVKALMAEALDDREGSPGAAAGEAQPKAGTRARAGSLRDLADGKRERQPLDPINIRDLIVPGLGNRRMFRILLDERLPLLVRLLPDARGARSSAPRPRAGPPRAPLHDGVPAGLVRRTLHHERDPEGRRVGDGPDAGARRAAARHARVPRLPARQGSRGRAAGTDREARAPRRPRLVQPRGALSAGAVRARARARSSTRGSRSSRSRAMRRRPCARRAGTRRARPLPRCLPCRVPGGMGAGATTQFVVGLGRETDRELLSFAEGLEKKKLIHHAQFAAFRPITGTPLEGRAETPALRERRLYEADHLLRQYGFSADELPYGEDGHLPLDQDPKLAWALRHPERFPVELTTASREDLQRVPGFGPRAVERILLVRGREALRDLGDLRRLGVRVGRAAGYVTLGGKLLGTKITQGALFSPTSKVPSNLTISVRARFAEPERSATRSARRLLTSEVVTPCARIRVCIWPSLPPPPPQFSRTSGPFWRPAPTRKMPPGGEVQRQVEGRRAAAPQPSQGPRREAFVRALDRARDPDEEQAGDGLRRRARPDGRRREPKGARGDSRRARRPRAVPEGIRPGPLLARREVEFRRRRPRGGRGARRPRRRARARPRAREDQRAPEVGASAQRRQTAARRSRGRRVS